MNEADFEKTFREHFTFLRNIAFAVVHDDDTARDIVQHVFVNLWEKKDNLQIKGNTKSYLHRAVINSALNHIKKHKKLHFPEEIDSFEIIEETTNDYEKDKIIKKSISDAVEQLSPQCRLMFSLSRYSNLQNKEIAEHLNVSIKAVEKNIGKALKSLRVTLKPLYKSLKILLLIMVGFLN